MSRKSERQAESVRRRHKRVHCKPYNESVPILTQYLIFALTKVKARMQLFALQFKQCVILAYLQESPPILDPQSFPPERGVFRGSARRPTLPWIVPWARHGSSPHPRGTMSERPPRHQTPSRCPPILLQGIWSRTEQRFRNCTQKPHDAPPP